MVKRKIGHALGAVTAAAMLVLGGANAAYAAPTPDSGIEAGGTTITFPEPAGVTFTSISSGDAYSVALGSDDNIYAWGSNGQGRLGDGTTTDSSVPVQVAAPAGVTFTVMSAGTYHSVALGSDGNTYAWGYNAAGQLGDGTTTSSNVPVQVAVPAGVTFTAFSAGDSYRVALGCDGNS